jgi:alpha,alpha-trehalase
LWLAVIDQPVFLFINPDMQNIFDCHPLFEDVQMNCIFEDGKTFVDCTPRADIVFIQQQYEAQKNTPGFDLKNFVLSCFDLPQVFAATHQTAENRTVDEHIHELWPGLTRQPDDKKGSLIPLPNAYIVPGGRFGEVYYWDSYFTMLGLKESGLYEMIENMVNNFSHLISSIGYIPNGNRTYYLGRSQPPFYSLMVRLLAQIKGDAVLPLYLQPLETEYLFWMKGGDDIKEPNSAAYHLVKMKDGELLNRYWDENNTARPESYREDVELSRLSAQPAKELFRNLRAGAESGWDYSCRWFKDETAFATISTTSVIPVDLNCLLFHLEQTIAQAYHINGNEERSNYYHSLSEKRKVAIQKYCWNNAAGFYMDYDWQDQQQKKVLSLAGIAPLFFKIAGQQQADQVAVIIGNEFLKSGGLVTTLQQTGQQWDAPNGWAPLQWMAVIGLKNYGHHLLAKNIAERWIKLNTDVYNRTGKLMEKYNVVDIHLEAGGGEYAGQDGFGWTNGVLLAMLQRYGKK